jgi:hypothetical protein
VSNASAVLSFTSKTEGAPGPSVRTRDRPSPHQPVILTEAPQARRGRTPKSLPEIPLESANLKSEVSLRKACSRPLVKKCEFIFAFFQSFAINNLRRSSPPEIRLNFSFYR